MPALAITIPEGALVGGFCGVCSVMHDRLVHGQVTGQAETQIQYP